LNEDGLCSADFINTKAVLAHQVDGWTFTPPFQVVSRGDLVAGKRKLIPSFPAP